MGLNIPADVLKVAELWLWYVLERGANTGTRLHPRPSTLHVDSLNIGKFLVGHFRAQLRVHLGQLGNLGLEILHLSISINKWDSRVGP